MCVRGLLSAIQQHWARFRRGFGRVCGQLQVLEVFASPLETPGLGLGTGLGCVRAFNSPVPPVQLLPQPLGTGLCILVQIQDWPHPGGHRTSQSLTERVSGTCPA